MLGKLTVTQGQQIHYLLWNPEVHSHFHKSLPVFHTLTQMNAVSMANDQMFSVHHKMCPEFVNHSPYCIKKPALPTTLQKNEAIFKFPFSLYLLSLMK
jgi:hypothetical protein